MQTNTVHRNSIGVARLELVIRIRSQTELTSFWNNEQKAFGAFSCPPTSMIGHCRVIELGCLTNLRLLLTKAFVSCG